MNASKKQIGLQKDNKSCEGNLYLKVCSLSGAALSSDGNGLLKPW